MSWDESANVVRFVFVLMLGIFSLVTIGLLYTYENHAKRKSRSSTFMIYWTTLYSLATFAFVAFVPSVDLLIVCAVWLATCFIPFRIYTNREYRKMKAKEAE